MRYRKKPIVIEATQWFQHGDHPMVNVYFAGPEDTTLGWISTLEGGHIVTPGDYIITGVKGEHYPCKPDIFTMTYEPVEGGQAVSDTPRTDSNLEYDSTTVDDVKEFARQLERELDRACKMYRKLDIHALDLVDRIIRLEEAGDVVEKKLGCGCGCYGLCKDCQRASENWLKAKEAKP